MRNLPSLLILLVALAITTNACNKKENKAPVISILEPAEGATFTLPDSAHIEGTASDDEDLHEMSVIIKSHMGDTVFAEYPYVHAKKSYEFHYHFATADTGMYHLHVKAADHDGNMDEKEVMFWMKN